MFCSSACYCASNKLGMFCLCACCCASNKLGMFCLSACYCASNKLGMFSVLFVNYYVSPSSTSAYPSNAILWLMSFQHYCCFDSHTLAFPSSTTLQPYQPGLRGPAVKLDWAILPGSVPVTYTRLCFVNIGNGSYECTGILSLAITSFLAT